MRQLLLALASISIVLASCTEYQKAVKSDDHAKKYEMANDLYEQGSYMKAITLYEDLLFLYKGTDKGEEVLYKFANSHYESGDYILGGYYFRKFAGTYPNSDKTETAHFLSAYCYYLDSPKPTLDQTNTRTAIREMQLFIRKYPNSEKIDQCNTLIDDLHFKLEKKSYLNAKLYYELGYYQSAHIALENSIIDYPDSEFRNELAFYLVKSHYLYAKNSITSKQEERYRAALKANSDYEHLLGDSKFSDELKKIIDTTQDELKKLTLTSNK